MDGAKHGAWSNQTNLQNYDPHELRRLQFEWEQVRIIHQDSCVFFFFRPSAIADSIAERTVFMAKPMKQPLETRLKYDCRGMND